VADSLLNFNVEISPESHDPHVRRAFGKAYDNAELEASIEALMASSCQRLDLFFMVGLPYQDYQSVMETVEYCGELLHRYGGSKRIIPLIAPLAPFIDPGSRLFEEPELFGYRLFYRTLREHRQAMLMPTWKLSLNYETQWMTRDEIVRATYDGAMRLVELKAAHGLMDKVEAEKITQHILLVKDLMKRLEDGAVIDDLLKEEIMRLNRNDSLCGTYELIMVRKVRVIPTFSCGQPIIPLSFPATSPMRLGYRTDVQIWVAFEMCTLKHKVRPAIPE